MKLLKYSLLELFNNPKFVFLFVLNLSLGLMGFLALESFKGSLNKTLEGRSQAILGADFGVSARRPINDDERRTILSTLPKTSEESDLIELYSMVANKQKKSRLIQIKAIQNNFPFYGALTLKKRGVIDPSAQKEFFQSQSVWVYPEILAQLEVSIGDTLLIGEKQFFIADEIIEDAAAGISADMAPRIYMPLSQLEGTKLFRPGSVAWHSILYKVPGATKEALDAYRDTLFETLKSPDLRFFTHQNASQQMARLLERLSDFLGLSSLVALFLSALGSGFLFRSYLRDKNKDIAILLCLGLSHRRATVMSLVQILILGLMSAIFAMLFALLLAPALSAALASILPFPILISIQNSTLLAALAMGSLGSLCLCLPLLVGIRNIQPLSLLSNNESSDIPNDKIALFSALPALLLFWGLAITLAKSLFVGSVFVGLFLGVGFLLAGSIWIFLKKFQGHFYFKSPSLRWALRDIFRFRLSTIACFVSIGLGVLLLNLMPQIQESLNQELRTPEQSKVPSLFLFDIQENQVEALEAIAREEDVKLGQISPMIRARLVSVNGQDFDKGKGAASENLSREEEDEMRYRNRGFNLSYRDRLSESEEIVAGRPFSGIYQDAQSTPAEISLEKRFAKRLDLKIGDTLVFEVESVPVEGKVINLRSIRWTSFQPNFFVQFQPGVLEMAPKTFLATLPKLSADQKQKLQDRVVESLPNVSLIDVSRLVERISQIMKQMAWALSLMAILCLLSGFVVIYSIANHQANSRKWDIGLLKALGATFPLIRKQFLWQFALITTVAAAMGAGLSLCLSFLLSQILFDGVWAADFYTPILSTLGTLLCTLFVSDLATRKALRFPTQELLQVSRK